MNVMFLGRGSKAGAWKIRGEQLGAAVGATVVNGGLKGRSLSGFDLIVLVKRPLPEDVKTIQQHGVPIVWDIVDSWPQPMGGWWIKEAAMGWLRNELKQIRPKAAVATTKVMQDDLQFYGMPSLVLIHHARPKQIRNPIRENIVTVGYEGNVGYLEGWNDHIKNICAKRGWKFMINPASLAELDIVLALRTADGYTSRNWKSNVKLANAQGSGTPCILNKETAYVETSSGAELWADSHVQLDEALEMLVAENGHRTERAEKLYAATPQITAIAKQYRTWLEGLC